jgi:hypothetical protein
MGPDGLGRRPAHPARGGRGGRPGRRGRGFYTHNCLALEAQSGAVLGLAHQAVWARRAGAPGRRDRRASRRTEAAVWAEGLAAIGPAPPGAIWVSVGDRSSDVFGHLVQARALGWHCLIRVCQDRVLVGGAGCWSTPGGWRPKPSAL